jgi:hypothetical protein
MDKVNELSIRETPGASPNPALGPATRVRIRLDFYPEAQRVDYSIVAWHHPEARVTLNDIQLNVGPLLHGVLLTDICAHLASLFDSETDPFP